MSNNQNKERLIKFTDSLLFICIIFLMVYICKRYFDYQESKISSECKVRVIRVHHFDWGDTLMVDLSQYEEE